MYSWRFYSGPFHSLTVSKFHFSLSSSFLHLPLSPYVTMALSLRPSISISLCHHGPLSPSFSLYHSYIIMALSLRPSIYIILMSPWPSLSVPLSLSLSPYFINTLSNTLSLAFISQQLLPPSHLPYLSYHHIILYIIIISYYILSSYHIVSYYITSYKITSYHTILYYIISH